MTEIFKVRKRIDNHKVIKSVTCQEFTCGCCGLFWELGSEIDMLQGVSRLGQWVQCVCDSTNLLMYPEMHGQGTQPQASPSAPRPAPKLRLVRG